MMGSLVHSRGYFHNLSGRAPVAKLTGNKWLQDFPLALRGVPYPIQGNAYPPLWKPLGVDMKNKKNKRLWATINTYIYC